MRNGKYAGRRRGVTTKVLVLTLAVMLIIGCSVGGTLAWLTDTTEKVENTFTVGNVDIDLKETGMTKDGDKYVNSYKMVPGCDIAKDPKVTVKADSEKCYVFVKAEKSDNFDNFMTYTMANVWTALNGVDNVYYRVVDATKTDLNFDVIKDNKVSVKGEVTKAQMDALTAANYPTLTFTAYACQYVNGDSHFEPAQAWAKVNPTTTTTTP